MVARFRFLQMFSFEHRFLVLVFRWYENQNEKQRAKKSKWKRGFTFTFGCQVTSTCIDIIYRVLSTRGGREKLSLKRFSFPQKVFPKKNQKLFQILILFDDDIKESVKVADVQKCNFSQS